MNLQRLVDLYYHAKYDAIWASNASVDDKIDRTHAAWLKAAARIFRETGYVIG